MGKDEVNNMDKNKEMDKKSVYLIFCRRRSVDGTQSIPVTRFLVLSKNIQDATKEGQMIMSRLGLDPKYVYISRCEFIGIVQNVKE